MKIPPSTLVNRKAPVKRERGVRMLKGARTALKKCQRAFACGDLINDPTCIVPCARRAGGKLPVKSLTEGVVDDCPFCNHKALLHADLLGGWRVVCSSPTCRVTTQLYSSPALAASRWNRRSQMWALFKGVSVPAGNLLRELNRVMKREMAWRERSRGQSERQQSSQ